MEWTVASALLAILCVSLGSILQAVTGLGGGLLVVPLLGIISIELIPAPMIFASLTLSLPMAISGRNSIDYTQIKTVIAGLLLGTIIAVYYITSLALDQLGVVFGVLILSAVLLSIALPPIRPGFAAMLGAGSLSGFLGTAAGVGAPILACIYQHHTPASIRATLAYLYVLSSLATLIFLGLGDRFGYQQMQDGLVLMPGFIFGYLLAPLLLRRIDKNFARLAILNISTASAVLLIWRSLN